MKVRPLEVYSEDTNLEVIKPPGRRFPGSVIQGDSLLVLCSLARSVAERVKMLGIADDELRGDLEELECSLMDRLMHYQAVLQEHGLPLPYGCPVKADDCFKLLPDDDAP